MGSKPTEHSCAGHQLFSIQIQNVQYTMEIQAQERLGTVKNAFLH